MTELLDNNITKHTSDIKHSGGCQCFKDCNCIELKGTVIGQNIYYTHPLLLNKYNDKLRHYKTLAGIQQSLASKS